MFYKIYKVVFFSFGDYSKKLQKRFEIAISSIHEIKKFKKNN